MKIPASTRETQVGARRSNPVQIYKYANRTQAFFTEQFILKYMFKFKNKIESPVEQPTAKKIKISTVVYAILAGVILALAGLSVLAYGTNTALGSKLAGAVARVVPFPAVIIDYTDVIPLGAVEKNVVSVRRFYENQDFGKTGLRIDFSTPDGQKRLAIKEKEVLNKMVEDRIIEGLAKERGIVISSSDVDKNIKIKLQEYGSNQEDVQKKLAETYGWSLDDFKNKVVLPSLYQQQLAKAVAAEIPSADQAKQSIQQAKQALESGKSFAEVAKQYSKGSSANDGGEVGWATKDQLVPELAAAVFDGADAGNNPIESSLGFHIVKVEEKKKTDGQDVVRFKQIFVPKPTFADWLNIQMAKITVWVPLGAYVWDKTTSTVEFKDKALRDFEINSQVSPNGDASMMF